MFREWFTAQELEGFALDCLPSTRRNIAEKAKREEWQNRPRQGRGGGKEYHISSLPEAARIELARRNMKANVNLKGSELQILTSMNGLNQKQKTKAEARLVLVRQLEEFTANADLSLCNAAEKFAIEYEANNIPVEDWVKVLIPNFSGRTLLRWKANSKELNTLGDKRGQHRKGQTKIDRNPEMHDLIVGMLYEFYDVSCKHIMRALRATFPGSALPSQRRVQAWVANYKNENASILMAIQAPDKFKNKYQAAAGSRSEDVIALNQLWEFDSTPTDVMLADGKRHNIIGVIDVYSRRLKLHVSRTSKASAVVSLLRRAVLDWGVPQFAKLDNGADYKSRYMQIALAQLNITPDYCPPFTPEAKPHIERAFKTFSHDLMQLLPGYIGHNVAERKDIEARKSFAYRLMRSKGKLEDLANRPAEQLNLTQAELQEFCDQWCENIYHQEIHSGINQTPFAMADAWQGVVHKVPDAVALDIALTEVQGQRTIMKKGIQFENTYYSKDALGGREGEKVLIRYDDADWGVIYVYTLNNEFICKALSPERMGISRADEAHARKKIQSQIISEAKKEMAATAKKVNAKDIAKVIMDEAAKRYGHVKISKQQIEEFSTPALEQAKIASGATIEPTPLTAEQKRKMQELEAEEKTNVKAIPIGNADERYERAKHIVQKLEYQHQGYSVEISDEDLLWFNRYSRGSEYRNRRKLDENPVKTSFGQ